MQIDAYQRGIAAILNRLGRPLEFCVGHQGWAPKPQQRPSFEMNGFRAQVGLLMSGQATGRSPIPALEAELPSGAKPRPALRRGGVGELVKIVQRKCHVDSAGIFGTATEAALSEAQRRDIDLMPDGIVGPKRASWRAVAPASAATELFGFR